MNKQNRTSSLAARLVAITIGGLIGVSIMYSMQEEFNWGVLLGFIGGALLIGGISAVVARKKRHA